MPKQITVKKIAELAGVNASTVSRVLSGDTRYSITDEVKKRIMAVAEQYEYAPSSAARSLARKRSFKLGIILHTIERDMCSPYASVIIGAFCREVLNAGYQALMLPVSGDIDLEVQKNIRSGVADGYWIGNSMIGSHTLEELTRRKLPVITYVADTRIQEPLPGIDTVTMALEPGFRQMFDEIVRLGYRSYIRFQAAGNPSGNHRDQLLAKMAAAQGLRQENSVSFSATLFSESQLRLAAYRAAKAHLDEFVRCGLVLCGNDVTALGLCDALSDAGLRPGRDLALIGFDNLEENPNFAAPHPILSTIETHLESIGKTLAARLLERISGNGKIASGTLSIPTTFLHRESLDTPPGVRR